jgi:hypothetical protein
MSGYVDRTRRDFLRYVLSPVLFLLIPVLLAACGNEGSGPANRRPTVKLSPEPIEGDTVSYHITISWTGTDPDGYVAGYRYAIDPPPAFTEREIAEGGEGIVSEEIPGTAGAPDTTRVTKVVEGQVISFDWIHTPDTSHLFLFSATVADSEGAGAGRQPSGRFSGMHAVYVEAVDDQGAVSAPDHVAFTATTVAPTATITYPAVPQPPAYLNLGPSARIEATGDDPDGGGAAPAGYWYRILDTGLGPPHPIFDTPYWVGQLWNPDYPDSGWTFRGGPTFGSTFEMEPGHLYVMGIRAEDVAGAVEPFLDAGRNVFAFQSLPGAGSPELTLYEPNLGTFTFRGSDNSPIDVQVPVGLTLHFLVSCSAEAYGGTCAAMRWGLDLADLESDEGWSDWGPIGEIPPFVLDAVGTHLLYVQIRDTLGATTLAPLVLHVIDFPMDRKALWVDDFKNDPSSYAPSDDASVDAWYKQLFDDSGRFPATSTVDSLWTYDAYGLNDVEHLPPIPPELGFLSRFRLLVWYANLGYGGQSALFDVTGYMNRGLAAYLAAGGQLWVIGSQTAAAMMRGQSSAPNFYPLAPSQGDFAYDFMKLASNRIENALDGQRVGADKTSPNDNLIAVEPFPGVPVIYPAMEQDSTRWDPYRRAIPYADAVFDPIEEAAIPNFPAGGKIDSLFVYKAVLPASAYNDRLTAIRFRDYNPDPSQGSTQWFGFDMYWMKKDQAQEVFNRTIDWFREESAP